VAENESLTPLEHRCPQRPGPLAATLELEPSGPEVHFTLGTFWHVIVKRAWLIAGITFIALVLTSIYTYRMQPIYRAKATLEVESDSPQIPSLNDLYRQASNDDFLFLATQTQVLQSDDLAWTTMEQLGLGRVAEPVRARDSAHKSAAQLAAAQKAAQIEGFKGGLKVEQVKDSRILEVSYESTDPELAARIVNTLVANYMDFTFQSRYDFTQQATSWMEQQLEDLRRKVEKSQQALVDYERQNLIINVAGGTITDQRLQDLSHDFTVAQSERVQRESVYELVKSNEGQIGAIVQNTSLERLEDKYNDLKATYADSLNQYGPNFPKVVRLREQLNEVQGAIEKQRKLVVQRVRNDYLAAEGREKLLAAAMAKQKGEVAEINQRMVEHNILKREFDTNQQLYDNLMQRLKDATLSAGLHATNIHFIDRASPSTAPVRPNKVRNILAGLLMGLIVGVTLAFVAEAMDSSVRSTDEAERLTNAPALAVIPVERELPRRRQLPTIGTASPATGGVGLVVLHKPSSPLAESYRSLRTSVMLSMAPHPPQTLLVTSPQVGEGKTSTATNLAISFAQRGGPILIIDADLRRPAVARTLGVSNEKGLSSYLTGAHTLDEVLMQYEGVPNLWVLPAGPRPPDPAELLSSQMMTDTLAGLMKRFTQIIIDSPPVLLVTDGVVLSATVDGVILVVASGVTARGALVRARRILDNAGSRLLGVVLNKVDMRFDTYYGSYYGSYYGPYTETYEDDDVAVSGSPHSGGGAHTRDRDSSRGA